MRNLVIRFHTDMTVECLAVMREIAPDLCTYMGWTLFRKEMRHGQQNENFPQMRDAELALVYEDNKPVAYAYVSSVGATSRRLFGVYVTPSKRRKGLSTALSKHLLNGRWRAEFERQISVHPRTGFNKETETFSMVFT